jgi:hypothetical protein
VFDEATVDVGPDNRSARRFDARGVAMRIFILRRQQIAFVNVVQRTRRLRGFVHLCVVAEDDVDQAVGTKRHGVRTVLRGIARELQQRIDRINMMISIGIADSIQPQPIGAFADRKHLTVERAHALHALDFVGQQFRFIRPAVMVGVANEENSLIFA